ncbi:50S ribosomal protein L35 [Haloglycomyces albus]|uniref:50S ribosomal protein L35 n=1 Tax=Haloglycomyces albus TaxID=526067 RepID=UPI00046CD79B|nr:50S ribosomal protein L35 [Haloglycomyces albus]
MPKMKSHSGAKKRFKVTGSGKVMRRKANKNHLLEHKNSKRKRNMSGRTQVDKSNQKQVDRLLGRR